MQKFIPIQDFRTLEYNSQQNSISFTYQTEKFWYQLGKSRQDGLLLVDQFRKSKIVEVNADDIPTNGSHIVDFVVLFYEPSSKPSLPSGWIAFSLLLGIVLISLLLSRLKRISQPSNATSL